MKFDCPVYLYIIPDPDTGRVYMGRIAHYNPDLDVIKESICDDLRPAKIDAGKIILMDVTNRNPMDPDLILALDGELDVLRVAKYNAKTHMYVMPTHDIRVACEREQLTPEPVKYDCYARHNEKEE